MSFRLYIYYCAMCGGVAAYFGWAFGRIAPGDSDILQVATKGMILGFFLGFALSLVDSLWNFSLHRFVPMLLHIVVAVVIGSMGGFLGGLIGQALYQQFHASFFLVFGWVLTGLLIGASLGAFDVLFQLVRGQDIRGARRKSVNALIGGAAGGLVGSILYLVLRSFWTGVFSNKPADALWSPSATGFVALGLCIGLLIGLAQVILKEAWVRVEKGFRPGRELILTKPATTIGRAEACDIGLFGDPAIEKLHASIVMNGSQYLLTDNGTRGGTFLNGQRITQPTQLRAGDEIGVGGSILRFGQRRKAAT
jgi:hypothetical protein